MSNAEAVYTLAYNVEFEFDGPGGKVVIINIDPDKI